MCVIVKKVSHIICIKFSLVSNLTMANAIKHSNWLSGILRCFILCVCVLSCVGFTVAQSWFGFFSGNFVFSKEAQ